MRNLPAGPPAGSQKPPVPRGGIFRQTSPGHWRGADRNRPGSNRRRRPHRASQTNPQGQDKPRVPQAAAPSVERAVERGWPVHPPPSPDSPARTDQSRSSRAGRLPTEAAFRAKDRVPATHRVARVQVQSGWSSQSSSGHSLHKRPMGSTLNAPGHQLPMTTIPTLTIPIPNMLSQTVAAKASTNPVRVRLRAQLPFATFGKG